MMYISVHISTVDRDERSMKNGRDDTSEKEAVSSRRLRPLEEKEWIICQETAPDHIS
jgi:hypothetical protein